MATTLRAGLLPWRPFFRKAAVVAQVVLVAPPKVPLPVPGEAEFICILQMVSESVTTSISPSALAVARQR